MMRQIAPVPDHPDYRRAMICAKPDGVYLFLYARTADGPSDADLWFGTVDEALEEAHEAYGIAPSAWMPIADAPPGCFDDHIAPTLMPRPGSQT